MQKLDRHQFLELVKDITNKNKCEAELYSSYTKELAITWNDCLLRNVEYWYEDWNDGKAKALKDKEDTVKRKQKQVVIKIPILTTTGEKSYVYLHANIKADLEGTKIRKVYEPIIAKSKQSNKDRFDFKKCLRRLFK